MTAERCVGVQEAQVVEGGMRMIFVPGSGDWVWVEEVGMEGVENWGGIC